MIRSITWNAQHIARITQIYPPSRILQSSSSQFLSSTSQSHQPNRRFAISQPHRLLKLPSKKPKKISRNLWNLIRSLRITFIGEPGVVQEETTGMPKAAYYAVAAGKKPGIYNTWTEAELQVKGYPGAKYKKFSTLPQAEEYIISTSSLPSFTKGINPNSKSSSSSSSEPFKTHHRAESPTTTSSPTSLPPNLQEIASKGYTFTKEPFYLIVHTDGSALGNGKVGSRAGAGVFWGDRGEAATNERVPGLPQTNNRGELLAVIRAIEQCPYPDIPLEIRCDSQYTISCMTTWLPKWLKTNFKTSGKSYSKPDGKLTTNTPKQVMNVDMIKHLLVLLRKRGIRGKVKFKYVPAHSGVEGNERADQLAKMGSLMPESNALNQWLNPDDEVDLDDDQFSNGNENKNDITDIAVEMDENWLMSPEELENFEKDLLDE